MGLRIKIKSLGISKNEEPEEKFESVPSCCLRVVALDGAVILTGKALENSDVGRKIGKSMEKNYASQCGFCTAGMAISICTKKENQNAAEVIRGNYCRCTGYRKSVKMKLNSLIFCSGGPWMNLI